jgi:surface protein
MISMFKNSDKFNQPINTTQNVTMNGSTYTAWDTSNVTNMEEMFRSATVFNQDIRDWDVSNVTDFTYMFYGASDMITEYNTTSGFGITPNPWFWNGIEPDKYQFADKAKLEEAVNLWISDNNSAITTYREINTWDTSLITDMSSLFTNTEFNDDISNWDVSNVTNMYNMFSDNNSFNQIISSWTTSKVSNMQQMFSNATEFNQNLSNWNVSEVLNMYHMFNGCAKFNNGGSPLTWTTSKLTNMGGIFSNCTVFDQPIPNWDTSNVTNMLNMFYLATNFNQDIGNWDTKNVRVASSMFNQATSFNQNVGNWDTSNITNMYGMFYHAFDFNNGGSNDISKWDTSKVTTMVNMFKSNSNFNQDITKQTINAGASDEYIAWNTSIVSSMQNIFYGCTVFNQDIRNWDVLSVTNFSNMFRFASDMITEYNGVSGFGITPNPWFWNGIEPPIYQFADKAELQTAVNLWISDKTSAITTYSEINTWDTSLITNMSSLFSSKNSFNDDIGNWDVSSVTNMYAMFHSANVFNQPIGNWNVSLVTNMKHMFNTAKAFNQPINTTSSVTMNGSTYTAWDVSSVIFMNEMFHNAHAFNQPIGDWNVSSVFLMSYMFDTAKVFNQPIGNWNVSAVINFYAMFYNAHAFNQPIGDWDVSSVDTMEKMFHTATGFNQPINTTSNVTMNGSTYTAWDVSHATSFKEMFYSATVFNQDIRNFSVQSGDNISNMLYSADVFQNNFFGNTNNDTPPISFFNQSYIRYLKWDSGGSNYPLQEAQVWINGVNVAQNIGVHVEDSAYTHPTYKGPKLYNNKLNFFPSGGELVYRTSAVTLDLGQNYNYDDLQMILVLPRIASHKTRSGEDYFNSSNTSGFSWANGSVYGEFDFSILDENGTAIATYNEIGSTAALRKVAHKYKFNKYSTLIETQESDWSYLYGVDVSWTYGAASNGWKIPTDNCVMTTGAGANSGIDGTIQVYDYVAP